MAALLRRVFFCITEKAGECSVLTKQAGSVADMPLTEITSWQMPRLLTGQLTAESSIMNTDIELLGLMGYSKPQKPCDPWWCAVDTVLA